MQTSMSDSTPLGVLVKVLVAVVYIAMGKTWE